MEVSKFNRRVRLKVDPKTLKSVHHLESSTENFTLKGNDVLLKVEACGLSGYKPNLLQRFLAQTDDLPFGYEVSGTVEATGELVTSLQIGDEVCGLVPLISRYSGCALWCVLCQYDVIQKPLQVSHVDAASSIGDALKAFTALHYQARISSGETVVVCAAASSFGVVAMQLAQYLGANVIAVGSSDEEMLFLRSLEPAANALIDLRNKKKGLLNVCMDETGGIGVDCIVDSGVKLTVDSFEESSVVDRILPSKHDIISSLAVGGRWVTSQQDLQLDPPDSELLHLKCSSVHYLFEHSWTLSRGAQGRYLHILSNIMDNLKSSIFRPTIHHTVLLENVPEAADNLSQSNVGKVVVKIVHED